MKDKITRTEIEALFALAPADRVEVGGESGRHWHGTVESTAAALGILWIRTDAGERKMLDVLEHTIRKVP